MPDSSRTPEPRLTGQAALPLARGECIRWHGASGCATALALTEILARTSRFCLILVPSVAAAEALEAELRFFSGGRTPVAVLPDPEVLPYDRFSPHQDLVSRRLTLLRELLEAPPRAVLTAASTLLGRLPPPSYLRAYAFSLRAGQTLRPESLQEQLEAAGYQRVTQVLEHGDFAIRGSLVDFFPMGQELPVRVDFLADEIDSLRQFEPDSQLSHRTLEALVTLPAREVPLDDNGVRQFRQAYRRRFEGNPARSPIYRDVSEGRAPGGVEAYLPLFFDETAVLWDYLPADRLCVCLGEPGQLLDAAWLQVTERYELSQADPERPPLPPEEVFAPPAVHLGHIAASASLLIDADTPPSRGGAAEHDLGARPVPPISANRRDPVPLRGLAEFRERFAGRVLLATESAGRREALIEFLTEQGQPAAATLEDWAGFASTPLDFAVTIAEITHGAVMAPAGLAVLTEADLLGERARPRRRRRRARDPEQIIRDLTDLHEGSPIVHADHGVGRYVGLTSMTIDDVATEFVTLRYAGGDLLHVPVSALDLISRYSGASAEHAPLHRLGTDQWARARRKAAEKVRDVAAELLELYARRAAQPDRPSMSAAADYAAFAADFPFEPTEDQAKAFEDVIADLTTGRPMDRLVCGDVGFGKTEVALRAAFLAVTGGRQVAVLVPTTLLAQQHYQTFADRLADWPVRVALLSRFRSAEETKRTLAELAAGQLDIVVGTHRLLQRDITFKNLGLIIVDEEHRFGVRHKERLKALRPEADILTLTATPIPRTLNMALGGLRDLSLIATPPESRLTIKTFVLRWDRQVIREACLRELKRGGQVYFVHNRIQDIERVAEEIAALVPEAEVRIAHGQTPERELEQVMLDFYHGRFQILCCTAIIESGLDVPSANTIVINRADRFGLAQLHQLRGRVGRSHHQAFAYLLTPPREAMTADALKRLDAIAALEDLGSGFLLATHDMEIRGAGELLGEDQSGQIQEIGFELYNDMLARTVAALRDGHEPVLHLDGSGATEVNLHVPALLPEDYMPDVHLRLVHYKRIASASGDEALHELQVELIDRFGLLPEPARNLFRIATLRLKAMSLGLRRLDIGPHGGSVEFGKDARVDPARLVELIQSRPDMYRLDRQQRLRVNEAAADQESRFRLAEAVLRCLQEPAALAARSPRPQAGRA